MAAKAGLLILKGLRSGRNRIGDLVVSIDGEAVQNYDDFATILDRHNVGDRIKLGVRRNKKERTINIKLQAIQ